MMHIETPTLCSVPLSRATKNNIYLKLELLQPSGSFKNRGIGHFCIEKVKKGVQEFISSSGGNAGLAAAFSSRQLNVPITVVVPQNTSQMMINKIREEGARVVLKGTDWQEADQHARALCVDRKACYVPPFDDPLIWSGNATLVNEMANSGLKPDAIVVSVGGGGLFCGVVQGMHDIGWERVPVFAVETTGAASFASALEAGHVIELEGIDTVAKSLGARAVTQQALNWSRKHPVVSKVVSDKSAVRACQEFAKDHRLLVEPACGAALSLCYDMDVDILGHENILIVVCGGSAITPKMLLTWSERFGLEDSFLG